jgi:hypothetical protein
MFVYKQYVYRLNSFMQVISMLSRKDMIQAYRDEFERYEAERSSI